MRIKSDFARDVRREDHVWIPLADSVRLSARIWRPVDADADPVPAILEYIPYRKNDATAVRDAAIHRYADDVHYIGGCVFGSLMLSWASTMLAFNARPPDPKIVGERWRGLWLERLEATPAFVEAWLTHQRRDGYWKQGSVCENYSAIRCPVYMVGGWADGYRNSILRFLEHHTGPRKGLIGPWGHLYPHDGVPGPAIGFLQECLRWFDHWLRGIQTGVM